MRSSNPAGRRLAHRLALWGWVLALCLVSAAAQALPTCPTCPTTGDPGDRGGPTVPGPDAGCNADASVAVEARRKKSPAWSCPSTALSNLIIDGVAGKYRDCTQGRIVWSAGTCAQRVPMGPIYLRYFVLPDNAAVRSAVGFPVEGPVGGDPNGSQRFGAGYLATNAAGTAAIVGGTAVPAAERKALIDKWRQSIPGKQPAHDTVWVGSGAYFTTDPDLGFDKTFTIKAGASTTIRRIDVFTAQDELAAPATPTPGMTFTKFGIRDFQVQYCAGTPDVNCDLTTEQNWKTLATTTGNDKVWRTYTFSPVTAKAVRIRVTAASDPAAVKSKTKAPIGLEPANSTTRMGPARIIEIEAWE